MNSKKYFVGIAFLSLTLSAYCFSAESPAVSNRSIFKAPQSADDLSVDKKQALETLSFYKGQIRIFPMDSKVKRVAIGNGALVSATTVDKQLVVIAEEVGETSLLVWTNKTLYEYKVTVTPADTSSTVSQLDAILKRMPGVTVERVGPNLILSGTTHADNAQLIANATHGLPNIVNLVKVDEGFPLKKTVIFKVQIVEISKSVLQDLGIAWQSQINGPQISAQGVAKNTGIFDPIPANAPTLDPTRSSVFASVGGATGGFFLGIASSITSRINLALNEGKAFMLASPELSTKSGGKAAFLAGGEIPIPKAGAFGTVDVDYKKYGILLNITPVIDANDNISARIETELSQIDPSVSFGGFPAFLSRRTESDVSVKSGITIALSGLISTDSSKAVDKIPFLGDIPILGRLFRSENFRNKKTDLVIFVTPEIFDPTSVRNQQMLERASKIEQQQRQQEKEDTPRSSSERLRQNDVENPSS